MLIHRVSGRGSVYEHKRSGRWAASLIVDGKRRTFYAQSERDARSLLDIIRAAAMSGQDLKKAQEEWRELRGAYIPRPATRGDREVGQRLRFTALRRDGFTCQYCGAKAPDVQLHVDHIIALSRGGKTEMNNLTTACADCNLGKHDLEASLRTILPFEEQA